VDRRRRILVGAVLAIACFLIYCQTASFDFINYDDGGYVTENSHVSGGFTRENIRWAFTSIDYYYWQPLTWLSHMEDCQLFGLRPAGHHLKSVLFHTLNTVLVFALLLRLTGALWRSAIAAAIFALHPLRIESVAWIAERKDLLSGFLFLAATWFYLRYVERPSRLRYYIVLAVFALGLMAKPMVMTLPAILLLLDWWPLKRREFAEKVPMFGMAVMSSLITSIGTARLGSINWGASLTLWQRLSNSLVSYVRYLELSFWPHDLAILYPFRTSVPIWQVLGAALLLLTITALTVWQAKRRPYLIVGWLWFAVGLLPAAGLVQVGRQAMADRFTYLPHVGLAIAVVWGVAEVLGNHRQTAAVILAVAAIGGLSIATLRQLPLWHDSVSIFRQTVAVTGDNSGARHFLAAALDSRGLYDESFPHHAEAARLEKSYFIAQYCYGVALERRGQLEPAVERFRLALQYFPDYPDARRHLEEDQKLLDLSKASGSKLKSER
jgi:tetratricopeptide (TPR) repeat protein